MGVNCRRPAGSHSRHPMTQKGKTVATVIGLRSKAGLLVVPFNVVSIAGIFLLDAVTPAENVSVCFAYAIPVILSLLDGGRRVFLYAAVATTLSFLGFFIQPYDDAITWSFVLNRVIAVATQWVVAFLVRYRVAMEAALNRSLDEQREEVERQRRFMAMLSHEVRTPLTVMDGQAYRILKRSGTMAPGDIAARAQKIRDAAARIDRIIAAILASAAIERNDPRADVRPLDLKALLREVIQNAAEGGAALVSADLDGLPARIEGDQTLLFQVFENILANAVKYSPPGTPIAVYGLRRGHEVVVSVADRGTGVGAEDLPNLFMPYYRGGNSRGVPGAGMGLHLVERFVAAHGGTVSLDSRPGAGTTVTVRLPQPPSRTGGDQP